MKKLATALVIAATLTGCATQTANLRPATQTNDVVTSHKFFVSGIGQEKTIDAAAVCGGADKVAKVQSKQEAKDVLLGVVTFGIYTPRTATVSCR